jgi:hypothetical protein
LNPVQNLTTSKNSFINYESALTTAMKIFNESVNGNHTRNDCK